MRPKLYGLIRQHMSLENKDEVSKETDYETWHANMDPKNSGRQLRKCTK
jgi:hypothetical protein